MMSGDVLVVEDDRDLRELTKEVLVDDGFRVRAAEDGLVALERVAEQMPAVILLDVRMPRMSGPEFCRAFRDSYGRAAKIVVVTADATAPSLVRAMEADEVVAKPLMADDLLAVVHRYTDGPHLHLVRDIT